MRTTWFYLLVLVMVAAIGLSTGGCSKSDDAEVMPRRLQSRRRRPRTPRPESGWHG